MTYPKAVTRKPNGDYRILLDAYSGEFWTITAADAARLLDNLQNALTTDGPEQLAGA